MIHFRGLLPLTEFCLVQNSLYVQVLRSPILAALLHVTPAADVSQSLRRHTGNGTTELSQRTPPIFGRAAITLGIGPHSSFKCVVNNALSAILPTTLVVQVMQPIQYVSLDSNF